MRARILRPGFFKNEALCELPAHARLLFQGLWCLADADGILEDRPKRILAEIFPYEQLNIEVMLNDLQNSQFIVRYCINNEHYIKVNKFTEHQNPHWKEPKKGYPQPIENISESNIDSTLIEPCSNVELNTSEDSRKLASSLLTVSVSGSGSVYGSGSKKTRGRAKQKLNQPTEPKPIWSETEFFRMDSRGFEKAKTWFQKHKLPEALLPFAIDCVDSWLGSDGAKAIKARSAPDHHRQLFAPWAIENALKLYKASNGKEPERKTTLSKAFLDSIPDYDDSEKNDHAKN